VAAAADGVADAAKQHQDKADDQRHDPEGPQNGHLQHEAEQQQDDSDDDHGVPPEGT
jgi:hypothetical protein